MELYEIRNGLDQAHLKIEEFYTSLGIGEKNREIARLQNLSMQDDFWNDPQHARKILDEMNSMKKIVDTLESLKREEENLSETYALLKEDFDEDLMALCEEEYETFQNAFDEFEKATLLSMPYDKNNAILEIHPGAGGTESQDWANMLFRMYTRYADKKGFSVEVLDYLDGDEAGIKSVTLLVKGFNAYGHFKSERGVHRLVRISPFDSNKRRHTSFASVDVMPEFDDDIEVEVRNEDLRIDTYRASGAGGQHINKTDSAVRITHIPTGTVVSCQSQRSQIQNREQALIMLKSKLYTLQLEKKEQEMSEIRGEQKEIAWGSQIRSYVFCPYTLVKDARTGYEQTNVQAVMDGDIDGFVYAYLKYLVG